VAYQKRRGQQSRALPRARPASFGRSPRWDECLHYCYFRKTDYAAGLSDEPFDLNKELFADCPIPGIDRGFHHIGGAINERDEDDRAFAAGGAP
jgi:hypothetical protein